MLILNVKLALFALLIVPLLAVGLIFIQRRAHRGWRLFRKKNSNLNAFVHENMSGIRVVQGFAAQGQMNRNFNGLIRQQRGAYISAVRYTDLFWAFVEVAWGVGSIIVYWAGVRMVGYRSYHRWPSRVLQQLSVHVLAAHHGSIQFL